MIIGVGMFFLRGGDMATLTGKSETFESNAEIATKKVFRIHAATPSVITAEESVVGAKVGIIFGYFCISPITVGLSKCVCAPQAHVQFVIGIPFLTRWRPW